MASYRERVTRRGWALDVAVAGAVAAAGAAEAIWGFGATHRQGPVGPQAAVYVVTGLLLVLRRRAPLWCLAGIAAVSLVEFAAVGAPEGMGVALPTVVAGYSVARYVDRRRSWWGLVLIGALWLAWDAFDPVMTTSRLRLEQLGWISPWVVAWLVGALVRAQLLQATQRREAQREREVRAGLEERNRIARELHDVIGHSVSVMTVQASAVRRRLTPAQAAEREALESVEAVGREALVEMRRMVGVLRQDDDAERHPAPGLDQVDALVAKFRAAGLPVDLRVEGTDRELSPGLDLTVYRIVQEGLTNALRARRRRKRGRGGHRPHAGDRRDHGPRRRDRTRSRRSRRARSSRHRRTRVAVRRHPRRPAGERRRIRADRLAAGPARAHRPSCCRDQRPDLDIGAVPMSIGVLIADDQALVRRGFRMILEIEPDLTVLGDVADGEQAVEQARRLRPDVVLMDVRMPGTDGIEATRRIVEDPELAGHARVLMLTTFDMDQYVFDALQAGASGFLLKDVQPELLVAGIRSVHAGEALLAPSVTRRMIAAFLQRSPVRPAAVSRYRLLTTREQEILRLLAKGMTNLEIADELVVSETTVKTHISRVLAKLELRDRVQAVIFAYDHGLADPPE